jgi:hypothetical protein
VLLLLLLLRSFVMQVGRLRSSQPSAADAAAAAPGVILDLQRVIVSSSGCRAKWQTKTCL